MKEELFELLFTEIKKKGMEGHQCHNISVAIVDNTILSIESHPTDIQQKLVSLGIAVISAAVKMKA